MVHNNVAILGASNKPERYSYKAFLKLREYGYETYLISPRYKAIEGQKVYASVNEVKNIDTLTIYVNPSILQKLVDQIITLHPRRIIFNPGTEDPDSEKQFQDHGIATEHACTLVLLATKQF